MKIRCCTGLRATDWIGPGAKRTADVVDFPILHADSAGAFMFEHSGAEIASVTNGKGPPHSQHSKETHKGYAYFQIAVVYTALRPTTNGARNESATLVPQVILIMSTLFVFFFFFNRNPLNIFFYTLTVTLTNPN